MELETRADQELNAALAGVADPTDAQFRLLVETVSDYAIYLLDATGHVMSWNAGAERIKGYRAEEIIGQHFSRFYPREVAAQGWPEHELEAAAREAASRTRAGACAGTARASGPPHRPHACRGDAFWPRTGRPF